MPNPIEFLPETPFNRRTLLKRSALGLGAVALGGLLRERSVRAADDELGPHFPPRAKRIIFLCQSGAPSQIDLFDPKPELLRRQGEELPESVRDGQLLTTMTAEQRSKPLTGSAFAFAKHGNCGMELSELLPFTARQADRLCLVRSVHTEAINHDPGITFLQTGSEQPGRPSLGAWVTYGLGSENEELPAFVVLISGGEPGDQPLFGRLWGSAFLPGETQGVRFRGGREPLLYLENPSGLSEANRGRMVSAISRLNELHFEEFGDTETQARTRQFERAYRMQMSVPELVDLTNEPRNVLDSYGPEVEQPGTFAANCLLARRLAERDVRFIQLYHRGWDHHTELPTRLPKKCAQTDRPAAAFLADLAANGLLEDTLVVWAGEFGRTAYCQGELAGGRYGRDHHPRCFSVWMAGAGVKSGFCYGRTDDFSYNIVENPVHMHDLQATLLHCLGIDHERLTFRSEGRDFRLTDVAGRVVRDVLA